MTSKASGAALAVKVSLAAYLSDLKAQVGAPRLVRAVFIVLCSTVAESLGLLLLVPLLQLVDGQGKTAALQWLLAHGVQPTLGPVLALFVALMLLRSWLARWRDLELLALRLEYVDALRARLESSLAMASWQFLVRLRHADVMHLLFDQLGRLSLGTHQMMQLLSGFGLGLASLLVVMVIAPLWTLALVLPFALLAWLLRRRLAVAADLGSRFGLGQRDLMAAARDFLAGLKLVKAHAVEDRHLADLGRRAAGLRGELLHFAQHQARTRGWFEVGGALLLSALLYGAAGWGRMSLPELLLIVLVFSRLLPVLRDAQLQLQQISHMLPAFHELQDWIVTCRAAAEDSAPQPGPRRTLQQALSLDRVSLRYGAEAPLALSEISLELKAGSSTLLMGASGSGKSTLADVAMGLLTPSSGAVSVDGERLTGSDALQRWRGSVAYVAQDTYSVRGQHPRQPVLAVGAAFRRTDPLRTGAVRRHRFRGGLGRRARAPRGRTWRRTLGWRTSAAGPGTRAAVPTRAAGARRGDEPTRPRERRACAAGAGKLARQGDDPGHHAPPCRQPLCGPHHRARSRPRPARLGQRPPSHCGLNSGTQAQSCRRAASSSLYTEFDIVWKTGGQTRLRAGNFPLDPVVRKMTLTTVHADTPSVARRRIYENPFSVCCTFGRAEFLSLVDIKPLRRRSS